MTVAQLPPRSLPEIVHGNGAAAIGDSITQADSEPTTGLIGSRSWFVQACMASGQRIRFVRNAGVSGNTTTQMLARLAADVIAYRPARCFVLGGVNDVRNAVPQATIRSNLTTIYTRLIKSGIEPIPCTLTPHVLFHAGVETLNAWIRSYASRHGLWLCDLAATTTDPLTFDWKTGYSDDGLHPTFTASLAMAQQAVTDTVALFSNAPPYLDRYGHIQADAANMLKSGCFQADTNADGISDNWVLGGSGVGATLSRVADAAIFGYWQKMVASTAVLRYFDQTIPSGSLWSVGDRLAFAGLITTTGIVAGGMVVNAALLFTNGSSSPEPNQCYPLWSFAQDVSQWRFYAEAIIPSGTTQLEVQLIGTAAGTGTVQWAQVTLINLTTMGVV